MNRKALVVFVLGAAIILAGCEGNQIFNPTVGQAYPGGALDVEVYGYANPANPPVNVIIAFDPDVTALNGNELFTVIDLSPYYFTDVQQYTYVQQSFNWYADNVDPGSYYVYAWLDLDGDGAFTDNNTEIWTVVVFHENNYLSFNGPGQDLTLEAGVNIPNYTFWDDFAAEIDFALTDSNVTDSNLFF